MRHEAPTADLGSSLHESEGGEGAVSLALVIAWSREEAARVGEVALFEVDGAARILGRGDAEGAGRVTFARRRPGERPSARAVSGSGISREQLRITPRGGKLHVERIGRCATVFRGAKVDKCALAPGETLLLKGQMLLLSVRREVQTPTFRDYPASYLGPFGEPCRLGLIGESAAAHRLRDMVAFHAKAGAHTLVLGPSGAGKELVARAVHTLSARAKGPFVSRNAATLPVGLVEAELFGNVKNYPNPGMPERPGLVGAADGGTLFLDEIGELPESLHASLLRVLDGDGEYHRLGEAKARRADIRLVGATNRPAETLKHDLLARLPLRIAVPGLPARREDIPLLIRHLLGRALAKSPDLVGRFVGADGGVAVSAALVDHLVQRPYTTHVRELDGALWRAMAGSPGAVVDLPEEMARESLSPPEERQGPSPAPAPRRAPGDEPSAEEIRKTVTGLGGNLVQAAKALGLPSRYALYRLLRKHGIDADELRSEDEDG
ncbi:MAG: sigma 54-interacting transcriptional regulator [Polyangiaceae bacterium]